MHYKGLDIEIKNLNISEDELMLRLHAMAMEMLEQASAAILQQENSSNFRMQLIYIKAFNSLDYYMPDENYACSANIRYVTELLSNLYQKNKMILWTDNCLAFTEALCIDLRDRINKQVSIFEDDIYETMSPTILLIKTGPDYKEKLKNTKKEVEIFTEIADAIKAVRKLKEENNE